MRIYLRAVADDSVVPNEHTLVGEVFTVPSNCFFLDSKVEPRLELRHNPRPLI
jgi:hypothetical protein